MPSLQEYTYEKCLEYTNNDYRHQNPVIDDLLPLVVWFACEQHLGWFISGECESAQRVHDHVDPEQLYGSEGRVAIGVESRTDEGGEDSHQVDRELELQELPYPVKHVAAPEHCSHNTSEVVVENNNVAGFLGGLRARDAHGEAHAGLGECGRVVGAVSGHRHDVVQLHQAGHHGEFVDWLGSGHHPDVLDVVFEPFEVFDHLGFFEHMVHLFKFLSLAFVSIEFFIADIGDAVFILGFGNAIAGLDLLGTSS